MMRRVLWLTGAAVLLAAAPAHGDWDPTMPSKWAQFPDLTTEGIDVNATADPSGPGFILANDFECRQPGPITGIHIWGSWLNDVLPYSDPAGVRFTLSIHEDIPAEQSPTGYSMPGALLWLRTFEPGEFTVRIEEAGLLEGWMDPPDGWIYPADTICWQYNFRIDPADAFYQEGTPTEPFVYWLDVQAMPLEPFTRFGWKSSIDHWNDDAVWVEGMEPYEGDWFELRYPFGHPWMGESVDLAFVIAGEPEVLDWGDAPDSPLAPGYSTLAVHNGANHWIAGPWLGDASDAPDGEPDGQPDTTATGDDLAGVDDEDGVTIPVLTAGLASTIQFEVNGGGGVVEGWIDFNGDQIWQHPAEQVVAAFFPDGPHVINVTTPTGSVIGRTFARFRISSAGGLPPDGPATDGEVEDHEVTIVEEETWKWEQLPDPTDWGVDVQATEPFILAEDFLCQTPGPIIQIDVWGSWLNDFVPMGDPRAVRFTLSIHQDIPDSLSPFGYSMPGEPLWVRDFNPGEFDAAMWWQGVPEGWMEPPEFYFFPADQICWLYTFTIDPAEAFVQLGSLDEPIVYWLDVQAHPEDPGTLFGWKTSLDHWNDDAVWTMGFEPYGGEWFELRYPPPHPMVGESMDLAFRIHALDWTSVPDGRGETPRFGLHPNVPNPFNLSTTIRYDVPPGGGAVSVDVFDATGRLVRRLVDETRPTGSHAVRWDGRDADGRPLTPGVYFVRLRVGSEEATAKMLLLK